MLQVSEDAKRRLYETFNRNEQTVNEDIIFIKTWIKTQPHLPETMGKITIRGVVPELFENSNPKLDKIKRVFENMYMTMFPIPLNDAHRVYFTSPKLPDVLNVQDLAKLWFALFEVRLYEDFMIDDVLIVDMKGFTLNDVKNITPTIMAKGFAVYKKVYALRMNKLIYLNCLSYITILTNILKLVVQPKIFERIQFHRDDAVMKKLFSQEVVPKEYGGDGPSLQELNEMTKKKIDEYHARFDKLDTLRVDESLRAEKLNNDEILGFYGSFKKIAVD